MYRHIYIPLDNSEHSNRAVELGLALAKGWGAKITGSHVFAAGLHAVRFRQMESTLPERYQEETELARQRKIHGSLIAAGLRLISDSYLDAVETRCRQAGVEFLRRVADGKNWKRILADLDGGDYDLVTLGALGTGAVGRSALGSVCERVARRCRQDVLVVKDTRPLPEQTGPVLVGIDGSPQSFAGLDAALAIARAASREVQGVAVFDPYLHRAIFNSVAGVLSEDASRRLRLKDQEKLHGDIIDAGLAEIYRSHLDAARRIAQERAAPLEVRLEDGKAFEKLLALAERSRASLLVVGRVGVHNEELDIGSTAENLLRLAPCNVLLVSRKLVPPAEAAAASRAAGREAPGAPPEGAELAWSAQAAARLGRVPAGFMRDSARREIERHARAEGSREVTLELAEEGLARARESMARMVSNGGAGEQR